MTVPGSGEGTPRPTFAGFTDRVLDVGETQIAVSVGGSGPPVLLLHGYPQTRLIWHHVAPRLAERFTVAAADLRRYGDSGKPPSAAGHAPYAKRAVAEDQRRAMAAGRDRGSRRSAVRGCGS